MPKPALPWRVSPISVPQSGRPDMKARVPSIGSSTQNIVGIAILRTEFLTRLMPCAGKCSLDQMPHGGLPGTIGFGHGIEIRAQRLVAHGEGGAEERQDRPSRMRCEGRSQKVENSIRLMPASLLRAARKNAAPCGFTNRGVSGKSLERPLREPCSSDDKTRRGFSQCRGRHGFDGKRGGENDGAQGGPVRGVVAVLAALIATYMISQFQRSAIGVIGPDLSRELALDASRLGFLSSAFFLTFALAQIPVGIAIDRYGARNTLIVSALIAAAGSLLFAMAQTGTGLIAARAMIGAWMFELLHGAAGDLCATLFPLSDSPC